MSIEDRTELGDGVHLLEIGLTRDEDLQIRTISFHRGQGRT
jgi:hypothetical protein